MRLFVAFSLPQELRSEIVDQVQPVVGPLPAARWVAAENLHLTLQFLGEREEEEVERLTSELTEVFARQAPLTLEVTAVGAFPRSRPRVVWLGLEAPSRLCGLQREVAEVSRDQSSGARRRRPFRPHVTLARCRGAWALRDVAQVRECLEPLTGASFTVVQGALYRSVLGAEGAQYFESRRFPLRGGVESG